MNKLLVLVGPTAVGKTDLSLEIAERFNAEIVSADSKQFYKTLSIGTAKPSAAELARVPHHLVDFCEPAKKLSLAQFQRLAFAAIDDIHERGKLALMVGGTGQYVRAVVEGWGIPEVEPHPGLRIDLEGFADAYGASALHNQLGAVDQQAASAIDYRNIRRVVRALEVYRVTGKPISKLQQRQPPPYSILQIGLTRPKPVLEQRVQLRIDRMVERGLVAEVQSLLAQGHTWNLPAMQSLGYIQFQPYIAGEISLEEAVEAIKRETLDFVRRQYMWFRLDDPHITWFDLESVDHQHIIAFIDGWLSEGLVTLP